MNEVIASSTALYDYKPRTIEMMERWFHTKENGKFPVIGYRTDDGQLIGFASYGVFRAWPAYKYTVEHSIYVDSRWRHQGIGKLLLQDIIDAAEQQGYHTIIGGIDASNNASIALHVGLGFVHCGTIVHAGYKFGRWIDLSFYQRLLAGPENPTED